MSTLALYRELVPEHSAVLDGTVSVWLALAVQRHTASAWGAKYNAAMVWWAAHGIQTTPGTGAPGAPPAGAAGPIVNQRDGDLSRTYATPSSGAATPGSDADYRRTTYGQRYLDARDSRADSGPFVVF